ncbi:MAG: TatD family hydrolase, partial [Bacteroidales bacterium]|nr:TatD family hydrolase [Bacteroidales bacterium]
MDIIDTHTHLYVNEFDEDRNEVIRRAKENGVTKMILPGINSGYISAQLQLAEKYPENCFLAVGLHPSEVKEDFENELKIVEKELQTRKYISVGEIGVDLYWDKTFLEQQQEAFAFQIELAKSLKLPIAIHARDSFDEIFEVLDAHNDDSLKGVLHCFTGNLEQANRVINYGGFKLGIGGVATFKNGGLDKVIPHVDLKHLVLETDAPFLAPTPYRGKRN